MTPDGVTHYKVTYVKLTLCNRTGEKIELRNNQSKVTCMCCIAYAETLDV